MDLIKSMVAIIAQAEKIILEQDRQSLEVMIKHDGSVYTNVDVKVQQFLIEQLTRLLPGSGVIAEEFSISSPQEYTWVIDPVDGTSNYVAGLPYVAISVALMHQDLVVAGVVAMPFLREIMYAQAGSGLWRNGMPFTRAQRLPEKYGIMVSSLAMHGNIQEHMIAARALIKKQRGHIKWRSSGSIACDLAYVACGALDLAVYDQVSWWDIAAGALLVMESGLQAFDYQGKAIERKSVSLIAGNPQICDQLVCLWKTGP